MGISPKDKRDTGNDLSDDPSTLTERERGPIGHVRGDETARDGVEEIGRWGAFPSVSSGLKTAATKLRGVGVTQGWFSPLPSQRAP